MKIKTANQYKKYVLEKRKLEAENPEVKRALRIMYALEEYDRQRSIDSIANEPPLQQTARTLDFASQIIEDRFKKVYELMVVKAEEYVRGNDRLHNFRRSARMSGGNMPDELHGFLKKHLTSYYDMIDDINKGAEVSDRTIDEKIGDIIVYMFLQEAVIKTHNKEKFPKLSC